MVKSLYTLFGLYSSTPLYMFNKKELKDIIKVCKKYCIHNLGVNNRKKYKLSVVVEENPFEELYYGLYCPYDNQISLYSDTLKTLGDFTRTFVHEYTHSLQPCRSKYGKMLDVYGYDNHPFEIEARENEVIHNRRLLSELRKNC